jgi:hypothetical protein
VCRILPRASRFAAAAESAASKPSDTINLLVGFRPGVAYDLYARLTARYMLRYLPERPAFVVENKPENAQETVRRIYRAKPDGTTLAALIPALYLAQLSAKSDPGFDLTKLSWIGSPTKSHYLLYMSTKAPFKTMRDIRDSSAPPLCGAGTETTTGYYVPKLFEETLGTKFACAWASKKAPTPTQRWNAARCNAGRSPSTAFSPTSPIRPGSRKRSSASCCKPGANGTRDYPTCRRFTK